MRLVISVRAFTANYDMREVVGAMVEVFVAAGKNKYKEGMEGGGDFEGGAGSADGYDDDEDDDEGSAGDDGDGEEGEEERRKITWTGGRTMLPSPQNGCEMNNNCTI